MNKRVAIFSFLALLVFFSAGSVEAKLLPRFRSARGGAGGYSGVGVSVRFRPDRTGLLVSFSNLSAASSVTYTLIYRSDGVDQGVSGSLNESAGNFVTRELLFATCSSGVCRYHGGLSNMRVEVSSSLKNGKHVTRRFRIKI